MTSFKVEITLQPHNALCDWDKRKPHSNEPSKPRIPQRNTHGTHAWPVVISGPSCAQPPQQCEGKFKNRRTASVCRIHRYGIPRNFRDSSSTLWAISWLTLTTTKLLFFFQADLQNVEERSAIPHKTRSHSHHTCSLSMRSHLLQLENHCSTQLKGRIGKLHITTHNSYLGASLEPQDVKKTLNESCNSWKKNCILYRIAIFYMTKGF